MCTHLYMCRNIIQFVFFIKSLQIARVYCIIFTIDYHGVTLMKKNKFIFTVLVLVLTLCMLVACGEKPQAPNGNKQGGS